ncbi:ADP-ribosylglycohydrolase family protein [Pseudonocardia broussonetiae]|uniref:ADP-ribosylglycohydrolase family protein n=2 Tax=Pseudonocardia broussonetiae TaxID=2736640 RepID=A0A6M6JVZ6_9PSEU|nr:ADP-ribosylglycohydrolase family protein [Pseudonocardia broussonetiae]
MPTQSLPRALIVERHGPLVDGFHPGPPDHPLAAGLPAGTVTDDTEQAVLLGRLVVEGRGHVDAADLARRLVAWEDGMRARGSLDLLGPSTRRALAALAEGVPPEESGREGTTNGAAMRIAPVGLAVASDDLDALVDRVVEASALTHGTGVALAGAAAVAAAVSAGIDGAGFAEAVPVAVEAAGRAAARGRWVAAADVGERIAWAVAQVPPERIGTLVGTSLATQESVPAAFAVLAAAGGDPWLACRTAASLGGDTDTIAAMAGAVGGACGGEVPAEAVALVRRINDLDLDALAAALVALR